VLHEVNARTLHFVLQVHAVRTRTGELKFFSADEESDTDMPKVWVNGFLDCSFFVGFISLIRFEIQVFKKLCIYLADFVTSTGICYHKSDCRLSVVYLSVRFVLHTRGWNLCQYFCAVLYICRPLTTCKILWRSSQGNASIGGVKRKSDSKIEQWWTHQKLYLINGTRYGLDYN